MCYAKYECKYDKIWGVYLKCILSVFYEEATLGYVIYVATKVNWRNL